MRYKPALEKNAASFVQRSLLERPKRKNAQCVPALSPWQKDIFFGNLLMMYFRKSNISAPSLYRTPGHDEKRNWRSGSAARPPIEAQDVTMVGSPN